ncbi:MAG TPA: uridine diphosphate-N-acetylglucosamine-binding protein YvcK [Vicinamibacterales bacterium]|nr:uridine diphosphate-N-acetylglucosamine-binding protein YvcK [Vicinamibacterales bacterium]
MALPSGSPAPETREAAAVAGALRVAAVGGGTGLPNVLRGLRPLVYPEGIPGQDPGDDRLVAIVTTTDDGGSSGRLRREFGIIPPGDIRNCLAALAERESDLTALFQFRFEAGDGLNGHSVGNLMLTALTEVTGDFTKAVEIAGQVVGARGRVVPATAAPVTLSAELADGRAVSGETAIVTAGCGIRRLTLIPAEPPCVDVALDALRRAHVIIAGPGSLYTSILPALLIPELREAIRLADAVRVFVLNLMTEPGETDGFGAVRHLAVVHEHVGSQPFDFVVFNTSPVPESLRQPYASRGSVPITVTTRDIEALRALGVEPIGAPLASEGPAGRIRHHPGRLAAAIAACARFSPQRAAAAQRGLR